MLLCRAGRVYGSGSRAAAKHVYHAWWYSTWELGSNGGGSVPTTCITINTIGYHPKTHLDETPPPVRMWDCLSDHFNKDDKDLDETGSSLLLARCCIGNGDAVPWLLCMLGCMLFSAAAPVVGHCSLCSVLPLRLRGACGRGVRVALHTKNKDPGRRPSHPVHQPRSPVFFSLHLACFSSLAQTLVSSQIIYACFCVCSRPSLSASCVCVWVDPGTQKHMKHERGSLPFMHTFVLMFFLVRFRWSSHCSTVPISLSLSLCSGCVLYVDVINYIQ